MWCLPIVDLSIFVLCNQPKYSPTAILGRPKQLATMSWAESSPGLQAGRVPVNGHDPEEDKAEYPKPKAQRKKVVVVGLGMVGIAFM